MIELRHELKKVLRPALLNHRPDEFLVTQVYLSTTTTPQCGVLLVDHLETGTKSSREVR